MIEGRSNDPPIPDDEVWAEFIQAVVKTGMNEKLEKARFRISLLLTSSVQDVEEVLSKEYREFERGIAS